jgi:hypothetical protein
MNTKWMRDDCRITHYLFGHHENSAMRSDSFAKSHDAIQVYSPKSAMRHLRIERNLFIPKNHKYGIAIGIGR